MRTDSTRWSLLAAGIAAFGLLWTPAVLAKDTSAKGSASKPNDAQIISIVNAANTGEIEAAKLAQTKSTNDQVKEFAAQMIKDHSAMNDQVAELTKKLSITPEDSATSTQLKTASAQTAAKLQDLSGATFDKAYVDSQVADHKMVLGMFDKMLIPNAKHPELKTTLTSARPTIAMHLEHAQHLQAALKKGGKSMGRTP